MVEARRDELLGRLLGVPLDRFVEQRNRLVRELREQGDRETAAWLAGLRRPAAGIWALDQVARGDPDRIAAVLDLGGELRGVQMRALRGDREAASAMRQLGGEVKRAVDDVVRRGAALLRDAGHGAGTDVLLGMAGTLRAAMAAGEETRRQLAAGLLLSGVEEENPFGFDTSAPPELRVIEGGASRAAAPTAPEERRRRELQRLAADAAATADAAEHEAAQLRDEAGDLQSRVADLRAEMRALQRELDAAESSAHDADVAAREAQSRARDARRLADAAEAELPGG